jgi:alpha-L-fucosidase 2
MITTSPQERSMLKADFHFGYVLLCIICSTLAVPAGPSPRLPGKELNLHLAAPIKTWDEAIPLGNGTMGVLLWGQSNLLRLSLDRGDLWDERPSKHFAEIRDKFNWATMQQLVASNRMDEFHKVYDANYDYNGPPTKLPAGRVEITLDPSQSVESFDLNLATAEGRANFTGGGVAGAFVNAADVTQPVALMEISGPPLKDLRLKSPESVKKLGYAPPSTGEADGLRWFEQEAADGFAYAICAGWKRVGKNTLVAVTVATSTEGKSPQAVAEARVQAALKAGYDKLLARHSKWWASFWEHSRLTLPEPRILQQYYLVRYFYGAASRRGAPPMPLQGVWSADAGSLPPWKGDYHNDLNTQMTYLAYRTSGDFDEGLSFLDYLWDRLPVFRKFAKDFYGAPGAAVPGVMSLAGQPLGGWGQYSLSPTMGAWNAHLFYLHWRHTGDSAFLRDRAYPFCREVGTCLQSLLRPDTNGVLVLPLSSSPEIFDNSRRAFLQPNSNYDLASMKMLFLALAEMATAVGEAPAATSWAATARQLGDFHTKPDGTLLLDATTPLPGSHRHLSNLMALHPFNLITDDGGVRDGQIIAASLKDWDSKGTRGWCGYSFSWMACLRARVGDAETALRDLDIFTRAFILRNGFHANGDQTKSGFSGFTYRPFTLEGNFLAMEAVHEMMLQSWSDSPGSGDWGVIRVFPATPWRWHDASFEDLRAEGGHRVSARRENNSTTWLRIVAGRDGVVKIRNNFHGAEPKWSRRGVKQVGENYEIQLHAGESVEARFPRPGQIPPEPSDAAQPVYPGK